MIRMRPVLMVIGMIAGFGATAGCGGDDDEAGTPCTERFAAGEVLSQDAAEAECTLDDGTTAAATVSECVDGRLLISFDAADPQIWGMVDEPLQAAASGVNADDPGYVEMLDRC